MRGVIPRSVEHILDRIAKLQVRSRRCWPSFALARPPCSLPCPPTVEWYLAYTAWTACVYLLKCFDAFFCRCLPIAWALWRDTVYMGLLVAFVFRELWVSGEERMLCLTINEG